MTDATTKKAAGADTPTADDHQEVTPMATNGTVAPEEASTALAAPDEAPGITRLKRRPIIDTIDKRTLELINKQIAPGCTPGEVGHFLELCAHYELDAFAREAWCCKSKTGKLLIMVGRDGLRKIVQRNGLHMDCDVVREKDEFTICRTPDGNRTVAHSYGSPAARGAIVGAWAECRMGGPNGTPMGYFYAPLSEYKPAKVSEYSPWSKQVSVMILAAAERQAARQATPLGGLLIEGEDEVIADNESGKLIGGGEPRGIPLPAEVEHVLAMAADYGHAGLADRGAAEIQVEGQPPAVVAQWVANALRDLEAMPPDAQEVEPDATAEQMRGAAHDLEIEADNAEAEGDEKRADELRTEAGSLSAEADARLATP